MESVDWNSAALAGLIATTLMLTAMYAAKALGMPLDLPRIYGELVVGESYEAAIYGMGLLFQFVLGILFALLYAVLFTLLAVPPNWLVGAVFGMIQGTVIGLGFGLLPAMRAGSTRSQTLVEPGLFGANYGLIATVGIIGLHVVYGAVVGGLY